MRWFFCFSLVTVFLLYNKTKIFAQATHLSTAKTPAGSYSHCLPDSNLFVKVELLKDTCLSKKREWIVTWIRADSHLVKVTNKITPGSWQSEKVMVVFLFRADTIRLPVTVTTSYTCLPGWLQRTGDGISEYVSAAWDEIEKDAVWQHPGTAPTNTVNDIKKTPVRQTRKKQDEFYLKEEPDALTMRRESANSVVIIDKEDFEKYGYTTAGEALRSAPGVYFEDPSENDLPSLRGMGSGYTQVLIDGQRIPGSEENRTFKVDQIPANMIERIEIIRNSDGSTDAQGIAGTINIVLKTNPAKRALDVSSGLGYNQTNGVVYNTGVGYSGKVKKIQYTLKGNYQTRINGKDKDKSVSTIQQNNLSEKVNQSTRYEEIAFSPQVHWFLKKKNRFVISPLFLYSDGDTDKNKNKTEYINYTNVATGREHETQRIARRTGSFRVDHIYQVDKRLLLNNGITFSQTFRDIDRSNVTLFEDPAFNDTMQTIDGVKDRELFLRLGGTYMLSKSWHLQGVIEENSKYRKIDREQYVKGFQDNSNIEELYTQKEGRTNVYLINRFSIFRSNLNIGLRYESMRQSNAIQTTYITNFTKRLTTIEKESKNDQLHPIFQYSFTIRPDKVLKEIVRKIYMEEKNIQGEDSLKLKKDKLFQYSDIVIKPNISRNVRRPSFTDMNSYVEYFDGTLFNPDKGGNPYLKPEVAYGFDLAVEYYPRGKKGVIGVNYYSRWISNMIVKYVEFDVNSERFIQRPTNVGNGVAWGWELDGRYEFNIRKSAILLLRSNITIPRSSIVNPVSGEKAPIKNQPRFFYNIGSDVTLKKWKNFMMGINYNHYPGFYREIFTSAVIRQEIYQMPLRKIDCYTGIQLSKYFTCRVSAQNFIRSQKYKEDINYDAVGIQNIRKFEREIYRPTYLFTLIYKL